MKNYDVVAAPKMEYPDYVRFWLGEDEDIRKVLDECLDNEAMGLPNYAVENRIRYRLANDADFFAEVVEGGTLDEDFDFYLRCIHGDDEHVTEDEWADAYSKWIHLTTRNQIAYEYLGREELISLVPEWYGELVKDGLMECYNEAIQKGDTLPLPVKRTAWDF